MGARSWEPLRRRGEIDTLRRDGRRASSPPVTLWAREQEGRSRVVLSVPASPLGHVARNTVRRRLRAVLDDLLPGTGLDVMVAVRGDTTPSFRELHDALGAALAKLAVAGPGCERVG